MLLQKSLIPLALTLSAIKHWILDNNISIASYEVLNEHFKDFTRNLITLITVKLTVLKNGKVLSVLSTC